MCVGSDTTWEKRVPDTANLCVVLATPPYKSKIQHIMPPRPSKLLGKKNTLSSTGQPRTVAAVAAAPTEPADASAAAATAVYPSVGYITAALERIGDNDTTTNQTMTMTMTMTQQPTRR